MIDEILASVNCPNKFGNRTVLAYAGKDKRNRSLVWVLCTCGDVRKVRFEHLKNGGSKKCGVCAKNQPGFAWSRTKLYKAHNDAKQRCGHIKGGTPQQLKNYRDKGICVSDELLIFDNWRRELGEPPTSQHSVDRIDPFKGYQRGNIRWATAKEQANNKRASRARGTSTCQEI